MEQRLMAFWRNSTYPYCLCGEIDSFVEGGKVLVKGYQNSRFTPFLILPYEYGENLGRELAIIEAGYHEAKESLHLAYMSKVNALIKLPGEVK